jgi:hypothetical protein
LYQATSSCMASGAMLSALFSRTAMGGPLQLLQRNTHDGGTAGPGAQAGAYPCVGEYSASSSHLPGWNIANASLGWSLASTTAMIASLFCIEVTTAEVAEGRAAGVPRVRCRARPAVTPAGPVLAAPPTHPPTCAHHPLLQLGALVLNDARRVKQDHLVILWSGSQQQDVSTTCGI